MPARLRLFVPTISFLLYLAICLYFFGTTHGYTTSVFGYGGDSFMFVSLVAGIVVAFWLAEPAPRLVRGRRFLLAVLACLFLWPNRAAASHWASAGLLPFFDKAHIGTVIRPNQNVLLLPFGAAGSAMIWQWQAGYSFTQSGGGTGMIPTSELAEPVVWVLSGGPVTAGLGRMIVAYCRAHRVAAILAGPGTAPALVAVLAGIGWPSIRQEGVRVFTDPMPVKTEP